jgi:TonB-dependent SusC/RagA subfamily outer membrane receptor
VRKTLRFIAGLSLVGTAACAHDGITAPGSPAPLRASASTDAAATASGPPPVIRFVCGSSLSAARTPLYVVDGVARGEETPDLEAMDIRSIEVVRGAAAVARYGPRASDGVVLITTRARPAGHQQ